MRHGREITKEYQRADARLSRDIRNLVQIPREGELRPMFSVCHALNVRRNRKSDFGLGHQKSSPVSELYSRRLRKSS